MDRKNLNWMTLLRLGYAIAILGINFYMGLAVYSKAVPPPNLPTEDAREFMAALTASKFFDPLLAVTFLVGAIALLVRRTAPLGIAILTPPITVIFFFHVFLTGMVAWGTVWAGALILLAWGHRDAFAALVSYKGPARC